VCKNLLSHREHWTHWEKLRDLCRLAQMCSRHERCELCGWPHPNRHSLDRTAHIPPFYV